MNDKDLPLDPSVELFRWGPIPGRPFYQADFVDSVFGDVQQYFPDFTWPKTLMIYRTDKRMVWLNEFPPLWDLGRETFIRYMVPDDVRTKLYTDWLKDIEELNRFENSLNLASLSDAELVAKGKEFFSLILRSWAPTLIQEQANYGSDKYLESLLQEVLPKADLLGAMEVLTAPEQRSFFQQEEIELAETDNLVAHQQKYFWLKNSYAGTQVLPVEFFAKRKETIPSDIRATVEHEVEEVKRRKAELQARHNLSEEIIGIAKALRIGIEWQDERKRQIFMLQHYKDLFRSEMASRRSAEPELILNWGFNDAVSMFAEEGFAKKIAAREGAFGYYGEGATFRTLSPDEAKRYWDQYAEEKHEEGATEVKGVVASVGESSVVRGKVRVVLNPEDAHDFAPGDVLVAPMTSPDFIFVMKQSAAIVTDTGGLTSHAAVVSREMKKPCIIGTKVATKVFKDGDMVEVDANSGIVRKI